MTAAVGVTNKVSASLLPSLDLILLIQALVWFFVSFIMVTSILFTNLFVGDYRHGLEFYCVACMYESAGCLDFVSIASSRTLQTELSLARRTLGLQECISACSVSRHRIARVGVGVGVDVGVGVGVLIARAGIIINVFQTGEEDRRTIPGYELFAFHL